MNLTELIYTRVTEKKTKEGKAKADTWRELERALNDIVADENRQELERLIVEFQLAAEQESFNDGMKAAFQIFNELYNE